MIAWKKQESSKNGFYLFTGTRYSLRFVELKTIHLFGVTRKGASHDTEFVAKIIKISIEDKYNKYQN